MCSGRGLELERRLEPRAPALQKGELVSSERSLDMLGGLIGEVMLGELSVVGLSLWRVALSSEEDGDE